MQVPFFLAPAPAGAKAGRALAWQAQAARLRCPPGTATHACRMARDEGKALCQRLPAPARQIRPPCPAAFCQRPRAPSSATRTRLARPAPSGPGARFQWAQALRRACRRRHPLSRPCQPERRPCLSGTPDRPSSPPAPCPARHAGAPPARMLKLQRLAGLGWPLRALPFSPGRSLALAPAPALTRSASLAKSATSGASPCPAARQPRRRPGWHGLAFSSGLQPCGAPCWPCPAPLRQPGLRCRLPAAPAPCRGHDHPPARRRLG